MFPQDLASGIHIFFARSLGDSVLLVGFSDGAVRVHCLFGPSSEAASEVPWRLDNFWELPLHCPTRGAVRTVLYLKTEACGHLVSVSKHKATWGQSGTYS